MQGDDSEEKKNLMMDSTMPSLAGVELSELDAHLEHSSDRLERALLGQIIDDKFKIIDVLGRGGMSVVYKANWVVLKKIVAVKTMHSHLVSDPNALMRFKQEAQAAIALDHANVIKVYHFGVTGGDDSKPYIVMDFVEGESLSERLKRDKRLPVKEVLQIFMQVCNALDHAHKKGVIHRDLKPSNIMLLHAEGEPVNTKLVDFGIAKLLPQEGEQAHRLTQTGDIFGSPMYMSPEQCMGRTVDKRSDVYALGCVFYEALSGNPPHMGGNVFETFHKHISEIPASLNIPDTDKTLLQRLDAIAFRALEKEPEKRYQSMAEFEADVRSVACDLQSGMRGTTLKLELARQQRILLRFMQAAPKLALLAAVLAIILGTLGAYGWSKTSWFYQAQMFKATPTHWLDFMPDKRKKVQLSEEEKQARLDQGKTAEHFSLLNNPKDSVHRIMILKERAKYCADIGAMAEEIDARSRVLEMLKENQRTAPGSELDIDYAKQAEMLADCLITQGDFKSARELLQKSEFLRERMLMPTPKVYINLGYTYSKLAEAAPAETKEEKEEKEKLYTAAITQLVAGQTKLAENSSGSVADNRRSAFIFAVIGDCYRGLGKAKAEFKADHSYLEAVKLLRASGSEKLKSTGIFLNELALIRAYVNASKKQYKEASQLYSSALPFARARFKNEPQQLQHVLEGYAFSAWNSGDWIRAVQLHDQAVALGGK